jgi:histidyl-tRNA synthetase
MADFVKPRRPSGFNEYLPGEQLEFNRLAGIIQTTYEKYGFAPLDTPDIELTEVLLAKGGGETEQEVYSFKREGSKTDLTLRYDLTVPLARYVAEHESDLVFPFRRYHIGKVHRAERAQAGRFREFYQADIDVIGSDSPVIDAEFPAIINEIFEQFNFGEFIVHINNRMILNGFFDSIGLKDNATSVLRAIDKMDKITHAELIAEFEKLDLNDDQIERVLAFIAIKGSNEEILAELRRLDNQTEQLREGVAKLAELIYALREMKVPEYRFVIDLKIARGLDYYTGTVYETTLVEYPQIGSVCSGGRYDDLASYYTKTKLPGVGISIGLTRLFYALRQLGVIQSQEQSPARVIVMPITADQNPYAINVAAELRSAGIPTMLYTELDTLGKKLKFADRMGFAHAIVVGANEAKDQLVTYKNMHTHNDETLPIKDVIKTLFGN